MDYFCFLDVIQQGEAALKPGAALYKHRILLTAPDPPARPLTITIVPGVDDLHAGYDTGKGNKRHCIVGAAIVFEVDKDLCGAGIGVFKCEGDGAAFIGQYSWIVRDILMAPGAGYFSICGYSKLCPFVFDDPEEGSMIVIAMADEVVKAVCSDGRPFPFDLQSDLPLCGLQPDLVLRGSLDAKVRMFRMQEAMM